MPRYDNRNVDQIRDFTVIRDFQINPTGSVLVSFGNTRVICSVSICKGVPAWMRDQKVPGGWLTAEYQMLPGATHRRSRRDVSKGHVNGRSSEIQRLIGRSLRAVVDLKKLPGKTVYIDCDVLDADGGTRCASITGSSIALEIAFRKLLNDGEIEESPLKERLAAISVGVVDGAPLLDLCYVEDSSADVDMNVIMTESGKFVEIQGTAEDEPFSREQMNQMLSLADIGCSEIFAKIEKIFTK